MNEIEFVDLLEEFESSDKYAFTEEEAKVIIKNLTKLIKGKGTIKLTSLHKDVSLK